MPVAPAVRRRPVLPKNCCPSLRCVRLYMQLLFANTMNTLQFQPEETVTEKPEPEIDARMTSEQVKELAEALSILSAKSSVLKERKELRDLMEENLLAEEVLPLP